MSSELNSVSSGDPVAPGDINQFIQSVNDLETGAALYRVASGSGAPYLVDFTKSANSGGHYIATTGLDPSRDLQAGQVVIFKANVDSPASSSLQIKLEDGSTGTNSASIPLHVGDTQVGAGQLEEDQIVIAIYNDTSTPRFDIVGVTGGSLGAHTHAATDIDSGTLPVVRGGTGLSTVAANRLLGTGGSTDQVLAVTLGSGLSLASGVLSNTSSGGGSISQGYNYDSTSNSIINSTSWWGMAGCSGLFTVAGTSSEVALTASHTIEAYPSYGTNKGQWRLALSKSGSSTVYLPNSTGQTLVSPANLTEQTGCSGTWRVTGLAAGTWSVSLQMQANSGNIYYGQTPSTHASCTVVVMD